jgi:hypothetical protein
VATLILFLAANPTNEAQLRVGKEYKEIGEKIQAGRYRDSFELTMGPGVSIQDLQGLLLRHSPNVVHFSGHGDRSAIVLEGPDGQAQMLSERSLADLLEIVNRDGNIRCVFLNACYSEDQARAISKHVDCVIGMANAISDDAAREFAGSFYQGLANGRSVKDSFDLGKNILSAWDLRDEQVPKLLCRPSVDPRNVFLGNQEEGTRKAATVSIQGRSPEVQGQEKQQTQVTPPVAAAILVGSWNASGTMWTGFVQAPTVRRTIFYPNGYFEESGTVGGNPYYIRGVYSFDPARSLLAVQQEGAPTPTMLFLSNITSQAFTAAMPAGTLYFQRQA